jgi:hypothetical protein
MDGGMQCKAARAPLADANQRAATPQCARHPSFPLGWTEMRRLLCRDGLRRGPPLAAPPFAQATALRPNASPILGVDRP